MASINILHCEISSASGDLKQTLQNVKNSKIKKSVKKIMLDNEDVEIPYYGFKKPVEQSSKAIKDAIREVIAKIVLKLDDSKRARTSLIIGTALIDCTLVEMAKKVSCVDEEPSYSSKKTSIGTYAKELSLEFGLNEFSLSINTACTSSVNAMLEASSLIECGVVDYAIVVGLEIFSPVMSSGFFTMSLLSNKEIKPFDKVRDGIILGEGIGAILLGRDESKWSLLGGYTNCNSQTITSVSQSGDECVEVMEKALQNTSLKAEDIRAVKAHGTGSDSNDMAEMNAMSRIFDKGLSFTALKPFVGHTIGASGALEIALFISCIDDGFLPKTLGCTDSILNEFAPIKEHEECTSGIFMCNYFGFGGNNTSLIMKREV